MRSSVPQPVSGELVRAVLVERLQQRFSSPVTTVIAGAGFGKSTAVAQAVRHNLVAPLGQNPAVCLFKGPQATYLGLYTSVGRAQAAFTQLKLSPHDMRIVSAPGYQLLKFASQHDAELWMALRDVERGAERDAGHDVVARTPVRGRAPHEGALGVRDERRAVGKRVLE